MRYDGDMATYILKLFKLRTSTTVRMGNGTLTFDVGDDLDAIRYAKTDETRALGPDDAVELWGPGDQLLWESHPPRPDLSQRAKGIVDRFASDD